MAMKLSHKLVGAGAGLALAAGAFGMMPAFAEPTGNGSVTATYKCSVASFTNTTNVTATVKYGTAQSGDVEGVVTLAPGKGKTISSMNSKFGWYASASPNGENQLGGLNAPGVDLSKDGKLCKASGGTGDIGIAGEDAPGKPDKTTKPNSGTTKRGNGGGLAKTGGASLAVTGGAWCAKEDRHATKTTDTGLTVVCSQTALDTDWRWRDPSVASSTGTQQSTSGNGGGLAKTGV